LKKSKDQDRKKSNIKSRPPPIGQRRGRGRISTPRRNKFLK